MLHVPVPATNALHGVHKSFLHWLMVWDFQNATINKRLPAQILLDPSNLEIPGSQQQPYKLQWQWGQEGSSDMSNHVMQVKPDVEWLADRMFPSNKRATDKKKYTRGIASLQPKMKLN
jgi:hypothetical protein